MGVYRNLNPTYGNPQKTAVRTSFLSLLLMCCMLVLTGFVLTPYFTARPGHDQSSYLFEAQQFLSGASLYGPHLAESNPPMIIWFSIIPVWLGHWMHGSPMLFLRLFVIVLILGSTAWCYRILHRTTALAGSASLGLLTLFILTTEFCIGPYNFGQREHLLIILLFPYILASATGAVFRFSIIERCALGAVAGIALWFKPHDVIIVIALEFVLFFRARSFRKIFTPEFLSLMLSSILVLLFVLVFAPLYTRATLPLLVDTYWALGTVNTLKLALSLHSYMLQVLVVLLACFLFRRYLRDSSTSISLLLCSVAASLAFDVQHNNWWYHAYPHQALLLLAMAYLLVDFFHPFIVKLSSDSHLLNRTLTVASGIVGALLCVIAIHPRTVLTMGTHSQSDELDQFLAQYKAGTTVYVFSTNLAPLSFAYNNNLNWGSRFAHLWMMPAIVQNEMGPAIADAPFRQLSSDKLVQLSTVQRTEIVEDFNYWHPSVVLVERCGINNACQGMGTRNFDTLNWFLQSPDFAGVWSHYQQQVSIHNFDVYRLVP
jgi:hypothetical protein